MPAIPEDTLDRVREAHDIVEVISRTLPLKKAGSAWRARCPFHDEKTPSFHVNPRLQIFKCFGCGQGGNVFHWVMSTQGLTFPEAVARLAEERGISVPRGGEPRGAAETPTGRKHLTQAMEWAHAFYQRALRSPEGEHARSYLAQRGYPEDAQRRFGLGYAPRRWDGFLNAARRRGIPDGVLEEAGLVKRKSAGSFYDVFRHRVLFPVRDPGGRLLTFAGRALDPDDTPKYLNGSETPLFRKSRVLFGLDLASTAIRREKTALLVEGYTDVLQCVLHGVEHVVAGMGTAVTDGQARQLARFAEGVTLLYDGDPAGQAAAERALETLLSAGLNVSVAVLPQGRDVDEILLEEGVAALEAICAEAVHALTYKSRRAAARHDLATPPGRVRAIEEILPAVLAIPRLVEREQWIRAVAEDLGGDRHSSLVEGLLRRELARGRAGGRPPRAEPSIAGAAPTSRDLACRTYVAAFLDGPDELRDLVVRSVGPEEFPAGILQRLYNTCVERYEHGLPCDRMAAVNHFQDDAEALAALAQLPEGPEVGERVQEQITYLEHRRQTQERWDGIRDEIVRAGRGAAGAGSTGEAAEVAPGRDCGTQGPPGTVRALSERGGVPVSNLEVHPGSDEVGLKGPRLHVPGCGAPPALSPAADLGPRLPSGDGGVVTKTDSLFSPPLREPTTG